MSKIEGEEEFLPEPCPLFFLFKTLSLLSVVEILKALTRFHSSLPGANGASKSHWHILYGFPVRKTPPSFEIHAIPRTSSRESTFEVSPVR